jgi:hypothetical protein
VLWVNSKLFGPENTFEYPLLMLNLLLHEMIHVAQKTPENTIHDKTRGNGRLIMNAFHEQYPQVPELSHFFG